MKKIIIRLSALMLALLLCLTIAGTFAEGTQAEAAQESRLTVAFSKETPKPPYGFVYASVTKTSLYYIEDGSEITKEEAAELDESAFTEIKKISLKAKFSTEEEITEYTVYMANEDGSSPVLLGTTAEAEFSFDAEPYKTGHHLLMVEAQTAGGETLTAQRLFTCKVTWLESIVCDFNLNFVQENRWHMLVEGLGNTMVITCIALLLGLVIGSIIAMVCSTYDKTREGARDTLGQKLFSLANKFCRLYLTVFRGTPVVVQLMIIYFVILASARNGVMVAALAFGLNSGAYIAEIVRGGIMSIDNGQFEAGRSLGFNYVQTMRHIVLPQTIKNVLPALANEFIALLKETSVAGYVGVQDLSKAAELIRGRTYSAFMPLIAIALVYLILVIFFTRLVGILERRLRSSDH